MNFWDVNSVFFNCLNYPVSYLEFTGTVFGFLSVWLATKNNILTWPTGIVNVVCLFSLFYQIQLYPDMFLQIYFFVIIVFGWLHWSKGNIISPLKNLNQKTSAGLLFLIILFSILSGYFFSNIHTVFPTFFSKPSSFPYADSTVLICSIIANALLAKRYVENWLLWIIVNVICIFLYLKKEMLLLTIEYILFLILAIKGFWDWKLITSKQNT